MSASTTKPTREQLFAKYVALNALSITLDRVAPFAERARVPMLGPEFEPALLDVDDEGESSTDLFSELWPSDEDTQSAEYRMATAKSVRAAADLFAALAGPFGQEFIVGQAIGLAETAVYHEMCANGGGNEADDAA